MLIAEELEPCLDVPVEVVPVEELESVLENSSNGTVVTSRYFSSRWRSWPKNTVFELQPLISTTSAKSWPCSRNFAQELCGSGETSPGILRAAEVILHQCAATNCY